MDVDFDREWQSDVLTRQQLREAGISHDAVRSKVRAGRWQAVGSVVVLHNGPLTETQTLWCAVLDQPQPSALAGITAAIAYGLRTKPRPEIHVAIPIGARRRPRPGVVTHRVADSRPASAPGVSRVSAPRAIVQAALWEPDPSVAAGLFIAGFQQRLVKPKPVTRELDASRRSSRIDLLRGLMDDVAKEVGSLAEVEFLRLAKRAGLPVPVCQALRRESGGKARYLDFDFGPFAVEVDGPLHWQDGVDAHNKRRNALSRQRQAVLHFTTMAVWTDADYVVSELRGMWRDLHGAV